MTSLITSEYNWADIADFYRTHGFLLPIEIRGVNTYYGELAKRTTSGTGRDFYFNKNNVKQGGSVSSLENTRVTIFEATRSSTPFDDIVLGAALKFVYTDDISMYSRVEWVQNITTNSPGERGLVGEPYLDVGGYGDNKRYPFYLPKDVLEIANERGRQYGGVWYEDGPGRVVTPYNNRNVYWMAETPLFGYKNGSWHHITTYSWGFEIKNGGEVRLTPINQFSTPSSYNQKVLDDLN